MKRCAVFGHKKWDYEEKELDAHLGGMMYELIAEKEVVYFYVCEQGDFTDVFLEMFEEIKKEHLHIQSVLVCAYPTQKSRERVKKFDEVIYLWQTKRLPHLAKFGVYKYMINKAEYVLSGLRAGARGGVQKALAYARRKKKVILSVYEREKKNRQFRQDIQKWIDSYD